MVRDGAAPDDVDGPLAGLRPCASAGTIGPAGRASAPVLVPPTGAMLQRFVERLPTDHFFYAQDPKGRMFYVSPSVERLLGYPPGDFLDHFRNYLTDDPANQQRERCLEALLAGTPCPNYPLQVTDSSGELRWLEVTEAPVLDDRGAVIAIEGIARDITPRRRAHHALLQSEQRYRMLVDGQPDLVVELDPQARIRFVSLSFCEATGSSDHALIGEDFLPFVHPDDRELTLQTLAELRSPPHRGYVEQRTKTQNGWRWVGWAARAIMDARGQMISAVGVGRDITDRKVAQDALLASERHLQALERISRAVTATADTEQALRLALHEMLEIFAVDGAWLLYPCDPLADRWTIPVAVAPADDPHAQASGCVIDPTPAAAELIGRLLVHDAPMALGSRMLEPLSPAGHAAEGSQVVVPLRPRLGNPWLLGLCARPPSTGLNEDDRRTLVAIAQRMSDALSIHLALQRVEAELALRQSAESALVLAEERAQVTLHSLTEAVITTSADGRIEYLNPTAELLLGWRLAEARRRPLAEVFHTLVENRGEGAPDPVSIALVEGRGGPLPGPTVLVNKTGQEIAIEASVSPIRDRGGFVVGSVLVFSDVTEARRIAREMAYQATHDALTGLINRSEFERRLQHGLQEASVDGTEHALCYIDLDQFKLVNDTCGHVAGDELLRQVSHLLQENVRRSDTLARLGGDEFGLLMKQCTITEASRVARKLVKDVSELRFTWEDKTFRLGVSLGLVAIDGSSTDLAAVLSAADTACYMAKEQGRSRIHVHHPDDAELAARHREMRWASLLPRAIEENRLRLYLQPIVPIAPDAGDARHFEILLRMAAENGDVIVPCTFLPAAERFNLCTGIDRWVVSATLNWLSNRQAKQSEVVHCAINLSGQSLGDEAFLEFVVRELHASGLATNRICFEITETAAVANLTRAIRFIHELKDLGCYFALDDFGSGLSSFAYLKNLPVDFLKIDGSFVRHIDDSAMDLAIVRSINEIGHVMGKRTIAEFVEHDGILKRLREMGVDYAQGYGLGRPMPVGSLDEN